MSFIHIFLLTLASLSLSVTYLLTTFTLIIRFYGAINNNNAKGSNLSSFILIFNSIFIAIALSLIAFMVDRQFHPKWITYLFLNSSLIIILGHLFFLLKINFIINKITKLFKFYFKSKTINTNKFKLKYNKIDYLSSISWVFLLIGFIFPTYLATFFYEYRTTCFQFSFIFNSLGTILSITYIDRKLSLFADDNSDSSKNEIIISFLSKILISRFLSSLLIFVILIFLLKFF